MVALWRHVAEALAPQVDELVISANRHLEQWRASGYPVFSESSRGGLSKCWPECFAVIQQVASPWFVFCPCDTPLIPSSVGALYPAERYAPVVWAHDGERDHPAVALVHRQIIPELEAYLASHGERRVMVFMRQMGGRPVNFSDVENCFH